MTAPCLSNSCKSSASVYTFLLSASAVRREVGGFKETQERPAHTAVDVVGRTCLNLTLAARKHVEHFGEAPQNLIAALDLDPVTLHTGR